MQQSTEVWILSAAVMVLGTIIGFAAKLITQQIIKRLDSIIDELQSLTKITASQEVLIRSLQDAVAVHSLQLQDHASHLNEQSHKILKLEIETGIQP